MRYTNMLNEEAAIIMAVDAGVLKPDENGQLETEAFCRFWGNVEKDIIPYSVAEKAIREYRYEKEKEKERRRDKVTKAMSITALIISLAALILRFGLHFGWF